MMSKQQQQQQQQPQLISRHDALSRFDTAVADFQIIYSPSNPIPFTDNGFDVHCVPTSSGPPSQHTDESMSSSNSEFALNSSASHSFHLSILLLTPRNQALISRFLYISPPSSQLIALILMPTQLSAHLTSFSPILPSTVKARPSPSPTSLPHAPPLLVFPLIRLQRMERERMRRAATTC